MGAAPPGGVLHRRRTGGADRRPAGAVRREAGRALGLESADGRIVGTVTLSGIVLGPFRSAWLGYWVAADHRGRGPATAAVEAVCRTARETVGLHRIEATTVLDNAASQDVLARCGFEHIGTAPRCLAINGAWRDHRLFQRILHDDPPR